MSSLRSVYLGGLIFVLGCGPSPAGDDQAGGGDGGGGGLPDARGPSEFVDAAPQEACDKMDIVFVIDNSGSMGQEQTNLAANFPRFIEVLDNFNNLDYRVAVTTTGLDYSYNMSTPFGNIPSSQDGGDNGELLMSSSCNMSRRWIEPGDPDPAGTFSCIAQVGTSGPSDEMPLAALKMAFDERLMDGTNQGFLREDALLAVVILTDEDDCSYEQSVTLSLGQSLCDSMMEPVGTYVSFLDNLKGDRGRWAVAAIAGPGPGDCSSEFGNADEAARIKQFLSLVGMNAVLSSICEGDLAKPLEDALNTFDTACQMFPPID